MTQLPVRSDTSEREVRSAEVVALGPDAPSFSELFLFMRDAELRFGSLRMRIEDRTYGAAGESVEISELWLRHPGRAKVVTRSGVEGDGVSRNFHVWVTDEEHVRTYNAQSNTASVRPVRQRVLGITDPNLPSFARVYTALTDLPMETLVDTFVHPHGFCRNVLTTARLRLLGEMRLVKHREAFLLRAHHPRTTEVLTDRPDHSLDVGVDRMTGVILLLVERVGDHVTRHAEVTDLELDPRIGDEVFGLHLSADVKTLY